MQKGDIVTVYRDPVSRECPEGKAKLIKEINPNMGPAGLSYWRVRFLDDNLLTERVVGTP